MIKATLSILGVLVVTLFIVINYSADESNYEYNGIWSDSMTSIPPVVFLKIAKYRWWVGLWSDSDGAIWIEIPVEVFNILMKLMMVD